MHSRAENIQCNRVTTTSLGGWLSLRELPPAAHSDDWAVAPAEVTEGLPEVLTGRLRLATLMTLTGDIII